MTLRSRLMIGLIATASFPLISFGTDATSTTTAPRVYTDTEIAYIRSINCDTFTGDAKSRCLEIKKQVTLQINTMTTSSLSYSEWVDVSLPGSYKCLAPGSCGQGLPPTKSETSDDRRPLVSQSGTTLPKPPKPPMGSGADTEHQIQGIGMAIGKLTPTDRDALIKMIREYLTTKGITLETPKVKKDETERKGWDGSIKGKKTATEIQAERAALLAKAKAKREEMKKEYVGHVTLMK